MKNNRAWKCGINFHAYQTLHLRSSPSAHSILSIPRFPTKYKSRFTKVLNQPPRASNETIDHNVTHQQRYYWSRLLERSTSSMFIAVRARARRKSEHRERERVCVCVCVCVRGQTEWNGSKKKKSTAKRRRRRRFPRRKRVSGLLCGFLSSRFLKSDDDWSFLSDLIDLSS